MFSMTLYSTYSRSWHLMSISNKGIERTSIALIRKTSLQSCKNDIDPSFARKIRDCRYHSSKQSDNDLGASHRAPSTPR